MGYFIKTGFWETASTGYKGWLDLDKIIQAVSGLAWGNLTGSISNQTDLKNALDAKQDTINYITENVSNKVDTISASTSNYPSNNAVISYAQAISNTSQALVDSNTINLTATKHTLSSSAATRTFTIEYTGDDITLVVTLANTAATYTFPITSLCVSEGVASGDNTLSLSGVSGDKYVIGIKNVSGGYYVASKNFGQ